MDLPHKVIIRCLVYNHEPYLRDCLEGFVMQRTNFPFKAVVHDDCSTDGSAAIIREYAEKYPDIIEPVFAPENRYRKGTLEKEIALLTETPQNTYTAWCEGDDYWIDPLKLQKQVDYMDAHPECSLICTNADIEHKGHFLSKEELREMKWPHYSKSSLMSVAHVVQNGGWFIHSCTILYRSTLKSDFPQEARHYPVADYPLQIFAALKGNVYYLHEKTAVYRYCSVGSWTASASRCLPTEKDIKNWEKKIKMYEAMDSYSSYTYHSIFKKASRTHLTDKILDAPHLLEPVCKTMGYVFLSDYMPHSDINNNSLWEKTKSFLLHIKWYPFGTQNLCVILNDLSVWKRLKLGWLCKMAKKRSGNASSM